MMAEKLTKGSKKPESVVGNDAKYTAAILDAAVDAIICIDNRGIINLFNKAAEQIFQYQAKEVIGKNVSVLMPEPYKSEHDSYLQRYQSTGEKKIIGIGRETVGQRKDGSVFPMDLSVAETFVAGKPVYAGIIRDITERKKNEEELKQHRDSLRLMVEQRTRELSLANEVLQKLANMDGLTKLANRRNFDETLQKEIQRAVRYQQPLSLMMCDIDSFKEYNDTYGHVLGDECLKKVAECLKKSFERASDLPARYGGEEFAVILPDTESKEARHLSERFIENIKKLKLSHDTSDISDYLTLSIGIMTVVPDQSTDMKSLIKAVDGELYKAKKKGRNRIEMLEL